MCGICGCGGGEATVEGEHEHVSADGSVVRLHSPSAGPAKALNPEQSRIIQVERDIQEANAAQARRNRAHFAAHRVLALNLVSSPGAGKTTLLCSTIERWTASKVAVVEGDQQTALDADRIRAAGAPAVQVNTGKGCHLDAAMIDRAFNQLHEAVEDGVLFIENVGNLVCPAGFDLGESHRVVIASVTEGDDKPLKYPDIFASADLMIVSKADLAEPCGSHIPTLIRNARKVRPDLPAIIVSTRTGEGMDRWLAWLEGALAMRRAAQ